MSMPGNGLFSCGANIARVPLLLGILGFAEPANAAFITRTFEFSTMTFAVTPLGEAPPADPVLGSFTVTWDDGVALSNQFTGITQNSLNIPVGSALSWNYSLDGRMIIGGSENTAFGVAPGSNDFLLAIDSSNTTPVFRDFYYASSTTSNSPLSAFFASSGTVSLASEVPEPVSAALLGSALVCLGLARRRRAAT